MTHNVPAGSDRMLVVASAVDGATVSNVSFNGSNLTLRGSSP